MKNALRIPSISLSVCLLVCLSSSAICSAQQQIPDAAVAKADALVRSGNYQQALAEALAAIQANPADFQPYYYAAYALYKQDRMDEAQTYAAKSLAHAPQESKPAVQRLIDAIANHRSVQQNVAAAQEAAQSGLYAKAAENYAAAWKSSPDTAQDAGLKAAHIWAERLSEPVQAAAIANYIVAHPQTPAYLTEAKGLLDSMQYPLRNIYNQNFQQGWSLMTANQPSQALPLFIAASEAEPAERAPHYMVAEIYVGQGNLEQATREMLRISQLGGTAAEMMNSDVFKRALFQLALDPRYSATIQDAFGREVIAQAQQIGAVRDAQQQDKMRADAEFEERRNAAAAAKQAAVDNLQQTLASLRTLLSQGTFNTDYDQIWHHWNSLERTMVAVGNCEITYHEEVKLKNEATETDARFSLSGLKAAMDQSEVSGASTHPMIVITTSESSSTSTTSGRTATAIGPFFGHFKEDPRTQNYTRFNLLFDDGRRNEMDEVARLLNEASLACTAN